MGETAYELLSLGLRYWFILLMVLTLVRAFLLMWKDRLAYQKTLRNLPDAGLVGEVVNLDSGKSQPLPREGLLGSGRACDIRVPGSRRREMEFEFQAGRGLKLIPLHRRLDATLDHEAFNKADAFALHGTVLELHGKPLRFRLFAGLDVPRREVIAYEKPMTPQPMEDDPWDQGLESGQFLHPQPYRQALPQQEPVQQAYEQAHLYRQALPQQTPEQEAYQQPQPLYRSEEMFNTWEYAPLPPEAYQTPMPEALVEEEQPEIPPMPRKRRAKSRGRRAE